MVRTLIVVLTSLLAIAALVVVAVFIVERDNDEDPTGRDEVVQEEERSSLGGARGLVVDTFPEDEGTPLEVTDSGHPWFVVSGEWTVRDAAASVAPPEGMGAAVIVVDPRQDHGTFTVTLSRVTSGAGVVFRYAGPRNFWYVSAAPQAATWRVVRVVDGEETEVETLGVVPVGDGTTIGVVLEEGKVTIVVNGEPRSTIEDNLFSSEARVGLIAKGGGGSEARWSHVVYIGSTVASPTVPPPEGDGEDFPALPGGSDP
jgi:hypothetical protein